MEATQKRGFFKGNLAKPFSRLTKTACHPKQSSLSSSSKVVPCSPSVSTSGVYMGQNLANYSTTPRVSTYSYEQKINVANFSSSMQKVSYANETWGPGDENVDSLATSYISNALERFKL